MVQERDTETKKDTRSSYLATSLINGLSLNVKLPPSLIHTSVKKNIQSTSSSVNKGYPSSSFNLASEHAVVINLSEEITSERAGVNDDDNNSGTSVSS